MQQIEPGLQSIFRWFYGIFFGLLTLGMCSQFRQPEPDYFNILMWIFSGILFGYLSFKRIQSWRYYLALGLIFSGLFPIVAWGRASVLADAPVEAGRLYVWLIPPLLIASTQYGYRVMLAFSIETSFLSVIQAAWLFLARGIEPEDALNHAVARLVLFTFTGIFVVRITNAQRTQRIELAKKNSQLTHFATTLEQLAVTRERNRMARELHDTLAHTLSGVNVQLKALGVMLESDPETARTYLAEIQATTRTGLHEARRALHDLRSNPVGELGLVLALQRLAQQAAERGGLQLSLDLPPMVTGLTPQVEQNLYRIAEAAINNTLRHAGASLLKLSLTPSPLTLTVADDGKGFAMADFAANGHYGLKGMYERALLIDGELTVESESGSGTRIAITVK